MTAQERNENPKGDNMKSKPRIPLLTKTAIVWVGLYLFVRFAIRPALPFSLIFMYMSLFTICILLYVSIFEEDKEAFFGPIKNFIMGGEDEKAVRRLSRAALFVMIPVFFGLQTFQRVTPKVDPPFGSRVIHPAPPGEFTGLYNPYREDKENYEKNVQEGRDVFFRNCVFCHGDKLDGNGLFADTLNLKPANFADPTTIVMLQESFVFWRVSKGGIGLPGEATPWDSAMPRWELILTEEERWKVILFLYDYTGYSPRTWE